MRLLKIFKFRIYSTSLDKDYNENCSLTGLISNHVCISMGHKSGLNFSTNGTVGFNSMFLVWL